MTFTWTDALNVVLQLATAYLATRNHKAISEAHRCLHEGKIISESNQEFIKDYLSEIASCLKK